MKDEFIKIFEKLDLMDARLENLQGSVANLKREQIGKDLQELFSELAYRKRMRVSQVIDEFKISRNWALNRMKKLAAEFPQIEFYVGNNLRKTESVLIYSDVKETEIILKRIVSFIADKDFATFADINKLLMDLIGNDIERTGVYAGRLVQKYPDEFSIEGGNKLIKR